MADNIYDYLKEIFGIEVKDYTFKRDYIKNPLYISKNSKISEKPHKEDLKYLYLILNLMIVDLHLIFTNVSKRTVENWLRYYHIKKSIILHQINIQKSCLNKHGNEHYNNRPKMFKTNIEKYGKPNVGQIGTKEFKQLMLCKYGTENYSKTKMFKETMNKNKDKIQLKRFNTLKKSGSWGKSISNQEHKIYELLKTKYPSTISQYKTKKYPWSCDFYIPSKDLFIEYQGFWTHGKEPFVNNPKQLEKVKLWESKNTPQYKKAIEDWTIKDPLKRKTAKENNLNWLEFFTMDEFMMWYNQQ